LARAGEAARRAQHAGLDDLAVALSHEGDIAVALVVALGGSARGIEEPEGA
jgi:phosphopantetheinyl transferase (holo-ACP synthase)